MWPPPPGKVLRLVLAMLPVSWQAALRAEALAQCWRAFDDIETAQSLPAARVSATLGDNDAVALAGFHGRALGSVLGRTRRGTCYIPVQFAAQGGSWISGERRYVVPWQLDTMLEPADWLVITDRRWSRLLLDDERLMRGVAARIRRGLILPVSIPHHRVVATWSPGFWPAESDDAGIWRWARASGDPACVELTLLDDAPADGELRFAAQFASCKEGEIAVYTAGAEMRVRLRSWEEHALALRLEPGANTIRFASSVPPSPATGGDPRLLSFAVRNLAWRASRGTIALERATAYDREADFVAEGVIRQSALEAKLHAAGFWRVNSCSRATVTMPEGVLLRSSWGQGGPQSELLHKSRIPGCAEDERVEIRWVFALRS